ncbi:MAG: hypothetical protein AB7N65_01275 [Vicinamibacterales bacterium]
MSRMLRGSLAIALALVVAVVILRVTSAPVDAQSPGGAPAEVTPSAGSVPMRTWGVPDLEGIWGRVTSEPLQRPAKYGNREFLTDEERAAIDARVSDIVGREADEDRRQRGTEQDVGGAYNQAIFTSHLPTGRRTSMIVDPPDGRIPALTPEAQKRNAEMLEYILALLQPTDVCKNNLPACRGGKYGPPSPRRNQTPPYYVTNALVGTSGGVINRSDGPEDRGHGERCMSAALPDFGGYRRIVQSRDAVAIFYDVGQGQGWQRVIPITDRPHLPATVRQWWGDSRGHWEGSTLVVDVTNFSPKSSFQASRENLHLVERWTRTDANTLEYAATIEDPTTWTRPWTVKLDFKQQDGKANRIYPEPRCHEGNVGMTALLAGARAEERAFAQGKGPDPATLCTGACGGFAGGFADEGEDANPR